jgi:hypothetical protein
MGTGGWSPGDTGHDHEAYHSSPFIAVVNKYRSASSLLQGATLRNQGVTSIHLPF